tara:strand:- start:255 stop:470 length:216 start_codon:yes stop_codon:yes gene_type:complete
MREIDHKEIESFIYSVISDPNDYKEYEYLYDELVNRLGYYSDIYFDRITNKKETLRIERSKKIKSILNKKK